jgi:hypothetical protein
MENPYKSAMSGANVCFMHEDPDEMRWQCGDFGERE